MSYLFSSSVKYDRNAVESFNRLKISYPFTLFDSQHRYGDNGKFDTSITGGGFTTHSRTYVDHDIFLTSLTGGTPLVSGYVSAKGAISLGDSSRWSYQIGKTIANVSDVITLAVATFTNGDKVSTMLSWEEVI